MRGTITVGKVELNGDRFCLVVAREDIPVTLYEYKILHYLMTHKGEMQTYDQIISAYRGVEALTSSRGLYTHVSNINRKIGFRFIESIRGIGYIVRKEATA